MIPSVLPGTRLGVYEIVGPLGAGGMGEVFRARDTKLQREVALKLLPAAVAADPERLARFTREAQLLAALNHPNIGAIYGLQESVADAGLQSGLPVTALVLELVEGPTLDDRIRRGPVPLDEAVAIACQIAEALEAAHEHGIIHRDLKPVNVKLRPDGTVKVLDFGLAKALDTSTGSGLQTTGVSHSPTLTVHATQAGLILGTAAYMAPEQARGRAVDRRADVWAFGVVLFEMLIGRRIFHGDTISDVLAAVIKDAPPWKLLPASLPGELARLLRRCLEKDPRKRLRDIGDAWLVLREIEDGVVEPTAKAAAPLSRRLLHAVPWAIAAALAVIAVVALTRPVTVPDADLPTLRYSIGISGLSVEPLTLPALSPDGQTLAYVKDGGLWVRALSQLEPRQIAGVSAPQHPFWSPDSRQIAYFEGSTLSRVALDGSRPVRIAPAPFNRGGRTPGGVWRPDGQIVFAPAATGSGLLSVSAQGGEFRETYRGDPAVSDLHRPTLLPDGRTLIFVIDHVSGGADTIGLLDGSTRKDLLTIKGETFDSPVYSPTGHIVFHRESLAPGVWAVPFSLQRQEITGEPFSVAPGGSYPNVSPNGTLVYADRQLSGLMQLVWVDLRTSAISAAIDKQYSELLDPHLSPDGRQALIIVRNREGGGRALVVVDLQRQTVRTLTEDVDPESIRNLWLTATTVVYGRGRNPGSALVMSAADGSGTPRELAQGMQPTASADGRHFVFSRLHAGTGGDLWHMTLDPRTGNASAEQLLDRLPHHQFEPALSPDGRLLAYTSVTVGNQPEVILRRYPENAGNWQVSANGGSNAVWSRAGDAIFYRDVIGQLMRVSVTRGQDVTLGTPAPIVLPSSIIRRLGFDAAPGDGRMLMVQNVVDPTAPVPSLVVVQNWWSAH